MFGWLRERRRRRLEAAPLPPGWEDALARNVPHLARLDLDERERLLRLARVFAAEKHWEGCGGLAVTDEMKATVAAFACLPLLNLDPALHGYYANVESVLLYPAGFRARRERDAGGVVLEAEEEFEGESWDDGPVLLSWSDAREDGRAAHDGRNLVLHEFAHKLDALGGGADGVPPLATEAEADEWARVMRAEFARLSRAARRNRDVLLDSYGATDPAEFFAVAVETFFERPRRLRSWHPDLYRLFSLYFRQNPAARAPADSAAEYD